ncbi:MAG: hypothetical protein ABIX46_12335 [Burkholderiaceae bacterium]
MDVFYYWKDMAEDRKHDRLGRFRSSKEKLNELKANCPDRIWIFRTPPGQKGRLQLLGRLTWSDTPAVPFKPLPGESHILYKPDDPGSVWFEGSDDDALVDAVTLWVRTHFPTAVRANFQGANGQHEMRGAVLQGLESIAQRLAQRPFRPVVAPA